MKTMKIAALAAIGVMLSTPIAAQASYIIVARVFALSGTVQDVVTSPATPTVNCRNNSGTCIASFTSAVTLQAIPDRGYAFNTWGPKGVCGKSDGSLDTQLTCSVSSQTQAVYAYFKPAPPPTMKTIRMLMEPGASGALVAPNGSICYFDGTNTSGSCSVDIAVGSYVTFTAQPKTGNVVSLWDGNCLRNNDDGTTCYMMIDSSTNQVGVSFETNPCSPGQTFLYGGKCSFNWQLGNYIENTISVSNWLNKDPDDCARLCTSTVECVVATYCGPNTTFAGYQNTCVLRNAASAFYPYPQYPENIDIKSWVNPAPLLLPDATNGSLPP